MILIEVIGIPYAGKTTLAYNLEAQLRHAKIPTKVIQEYKISQDFYERNKLSFEVNYLRALHIVENVILSAHDRQLSVILVDRGIVDSIAWFEFFVKDGEIRCDAIPALNFMLCDLITRVKKYVVVWIDSEPIDSTSRHGISGRIVNLPNLMSLRSRYKSVISRLPDGVALIKVNNRSTPIKIAQKILSETKVLRP
jgi:thymidylate kinase